MVGERSKKLLKERINFLLQQKGMTRKTLVNGLVTLPHFSNILAGRYLLADDIAKQLGKRLGVTADYILRTEDSSLEINNQADKFFRQVVLFQQVNDAYVASIPEKNDAFVIELSTALMKACYFQATNNRASYQALHETYLNFYLENFDDSSILTLPLPLRKAFFYYKLQFYRSNSKLEESISYIERLLPMLEEDAEIWIAVKKIEMEVLVALRLFDKAKKSFEDTLHRVQTENLSHHLSSLYIAESAYCFYLKLYGEAFVNLAKAEEYLVYMNDSAGSYLVTIFNNRILMLIATNRLGDAAQEVERFEKYLRQQKNIDTTFWTLIELHNADIALAGGAVATLEEILAGLQKANKTSDQVYAVKFYQCQLALLQENFKTAEAIAEECLLFFEQANSANKLILIYETIAICAEQTRQYKKSSDMYKKMTQLLKMN